MKNVILYEHPSGEIVVVKKAAIAALGYQYSVGGARGKFRAYANVYGERIPLQDFETSEEAKKFIITIADEIERALDEPSSKK